ncbi:hypothetical protein AB0B78_11760 [Streptomyces sp. NPDC040724]|uniref:hypothetical protein n=1 Tax=Streptomyces sp. NPDC040724 TaxID=3155612 RepID=UPI0033DC9E4B
MLTALTDLAAARGDLAHAVAVALARRTERLARAIQDEHADQQQAGRARAPLRLGAAMGAHGLFDWAHRLAAAAEELALGIQDALFMPLELTCVAELYTTLGDHDRADAAIAAIPDPEERAMACATCIGPAAADHTPAAPGRPGSSAGRHPRDRVAALATTAEALIRELHAPHARVEALTALAVELARAGRTDRAAARAADAAPLVRLLDRESAQALKPASLADAALPPQREHLLAQALAVGSWREVLPRLASLAPDAVRTVATECFGGT